MISPVPSLPVIWASSDGPDAIALARPAPIRAFGVGSASLIIVMVAMSCGGERTPAQPKSPPCPPEAERVVLETANVWRDPPFPTLTLEEASTYFARAGFDAGPLGVGPDQTELSFTSGPAEPNVDPTTRQVADAVATVQVRRNEAVALPLRPGVYRIVSSNGVRLTVLTCP